jgi:hypothetical protein
MSEHTNDENGRGIASAPCTGSMFFVMESSTGKIDFETRPQRWKKDCYKLSDGYEWIKCALVPMPSNDRSETRGR